MLFKFGVLLFFINCVRTNEEYYNGYYSEATVLGNMYSFWPSTYNGAKLMSVRKREVKPSQESAGQSEGGPAGPLAPQQNLTPDPQGTKTDSNMQTKEMNDTQLVHNSTSLNNDSLSDTSSLNNTSSFNDTSSLNNISSFNDTSSLNNTGSLNDTLKSSDPKLKTINSTNVEGTSKLDWKNPGAVKRAAIVFGGFALLSVAYFVFYRMKNKNHDSARGHGLNDTSQIRYGILNSEDSRDKMELSRMPLTMESEDEDEDLDIFDLGHTQKNKSLSYVNLERPDEDIVLSVSTDNIAEDRDNLLLDIEDRGSDTLINWSNNSDKFIL